VLRLQLLCTSIYETSKTSEYATHRLLDNGISFTGPESINMRSFNMNQQQTYRDFFLKAIGESEARSYTIIPSLPFCWPTPPQKKKKVFKIKKLPVEPKCRLQLDYT
jgi:hypothetical protein